MPGLVWNTMMSMSGGWFFVVASEAVSVGNHTWTLPGIGSYVALALEQRDIAAVGWAIFAMLVVILLYDQLLFRPLVAWSAKFRFETTAAATAADPGCCGCCAAPAGSRCWATQSPRRSACSGGCACPSGGCAGAGAARPPSRLLDVLALAAAMLVMMLGGWNGSAHFVAGELAWSDLGTAVLLGLLHAGPRGGADRARHR